MHRFKCKVRGGHIAPIEPNKQELFRKLLSDYEHRDITVNVTIEIGQKRINNEQVKLYSAFIVKAADHFGNDFVEMEKLLSMFWPRSPRSGEQKEPKRWSTPELNEFIDKASAHLAQFGFHF